MSLAEYSEVKEQVLEAREKKCLKCLKFKVPKVMVLACGEVIFQVSGIRGQEAVRSQNSVLKNESILDRINRIIFIYYRPFALLIRDAKSAE